MTVEWDNAEKTAVRIDFDEPWTWEDYDHAMDEAKAMIARISTSPIQKNTAAGTLK